jgi:hypothetical protein
MADVPIWVPVITAMASIVAGTIPLVINALRADRRDMRDRQERLARERQRHSWKVRRECSVLLRAARDFRVLVENDDEYNGPDKAEHGWAIRERASDLTGRADAIGMLVPGLAAPADALAEAATCLVPVMTDDKGRLLGGSTKRPDFTEYERRIKAFKAAGMEALASFPGR